MFTLTKLEMTHIFELINYLWLKMDSGYASDKCAGIWYTFIPKL